MKNFLKEYLKYRPLFYVLIRPREADLFRGLVPFEEPILDFGCGDGFFTDVFYGDLGKVDVGVDIDNKELKKAEKLGIYKSLKKYDKKKLPFPDGYFSTVLSNCVLEHVENLDHDLNEIRRVINNGGKLICTVMTDKWEDYLLGSKFIGTLYKNWMKKVQIHTNLLSKKEWDLRFKKAGFKIIKTNGYLGECSSKWIDILHYFSFGSLISYKLFGKWVLFPQKTFFIPQILFRKKAKNVVPEKSATLFYVLEK